MRYTAVHIVSITMKNKTRVVVKRSSAGLGLFSTDFFKKDEEIIEYTGELISEEEANRRGGKYLFEISDKETIDGKGRENIARYINHSCSPNAYAELDEDEKEVHIKAKRKINPGEEITYNYGKTYFNDHIKPNGCLCAKCSS